VKERSDEFLARHRPVTFRIETLAERLYPLTHRHRNIDSEIALFLLDQTAI
jgi:hypothetical protein